MSFRLAIIGNSHVGCLKRAWDAMRQEYGSTKLTFFAGRGNSLEGLVKDGRRLVATTPSLQASFAFTSGGAAEVDLGAFDAVLIGGAQAWAFFQDEGKFYSAQALRRAMGDVTDGRLFLAILKMLEGAFDRPIYILHEPLLASPKLGRSQDTGAYMRGLGLINATLFAPLGARMLAQPGQTIVNGNATDIAFAIGSKRLPVGVGDDDERHEDGEITHMNEAFGKLALLAAFSELAITPSVRASIAPA